MFQCEINVVKKGPFRIWKKNAELPGLAMSRTIGDVKKLELLQNQILYSKSNTSGYYQIYYISIRWYFGLFE